MSEASSLRSALAERVVVADGAMGRCCKRRTCPQAKYFNAR